MALVDMKKLTLTAVDDEKTQLLRALQKTSCVEIKKTAELENTKFVEDSDNYLKITDKINKLNFAFKFLRDHQRIAIVKSKDKKIKYDYKKPKSTFFQETQYVDFDNFMSIIDKEDELLSTVEELEKYNIKQVELKSEEIKLKSLISQLEVYDEIDVAFSDIKDTDNVILSLGTSLPS